MEQGDIMRHTLKASFEQRSDAQQLLDELTMAGYTHAEMTLSGATHSGKFTRQRHAVTLTVDSDAEMANSRSILERYGSVRTEDIENVQDDSEPGGADAAAASAMPPDGRTTRRFAPGAEPGALQFHHLDDGHYFGTQNPEAPPSGMTFQETMGRPEPWAGADEFTIRAEALGPRAATDAGDNGSHTSAEGDASALNQEDVDHAAHHAGHALSAWNKVKAAVRHGWDRVRS